MCGLPEFASALKRAGFDVLSVANNHVLDHGEEIFYETISICRQAGLRICGLRGTNEYYSEPVILNRKGMEIGILAYNWVGIEDSRICDHIAAVEDGVVNYTWHRDKNIDFRARENIRTKNRHVIQDIKKLRKEVDILVVMPHWGYEWTIFPPYGVTLEAKSFVEAGADLIIGSHPHVLQGLETYQDRLIAYSLGNFLFGVISRKSTHGAILRCSIRAQAIENHKFILTRENRHYQPQCLDTKESALHILQVERSNKAVSSRNAASLLDDEFIYSKYEHQYRKLKLRVMFYLFINTFRYPDLIFAFIPKIINIANLIILRLKGQKVRW